MRKHTLFCVFSLVAACDKPAQQPAQAATQPASLPIARKPPPLGPLPGGIDPMRDMREDAEKIRGHRLILGSVLAKFQPKQFEGFRCDAPENTQGGVQGMVLTQSAMGCRFGRAGAKDERSLIITIADYNAHPRLLSTTEAQIRQKATKTQKPVKVKGHDGYVQLDEQTRIGRGAIMLKRRFLVSVQLTDATLAEIEKALAATDIQGLEALEAGADNQITLDGNGNSVTKPNEQKPATTPVNTPENKKDKP
jgi:hypothetical protein